MNAEDRAYLEVLKRPPLSIADEWLIIMLEKEEAENRRLREAIEEHRLIKWGDLPIDKPHDVRLYAALAPQTREQPRGGAEEGK